MSIYKYFFVVMFFGSVFHSQADYHKGLNIIEEKNYSQGRYDFYVALLYGKEFHIIIVLQVEMGMNLTVPGYLNKWNYYFLCRGNGNHELILETNGTTCKPLLPLTSYTLVASYNGEKEETKINSKIAGRSKDSGMFLYAYKTFAGRVFVSVCYQDCPDIPNYSFGVNCSSTTQQTTSEDTTEGCQQEKCSTMQQTTTFKGTTVDAEKKYKDACNVCLGSLTATPAARGLTVFFIYALSILQGASVVMVVIVGILYYLNKI